MAEPTSTSNDDLFGTEDIVAMGRRNVELGIACGLILQGHEAHQPPNFVLDEAWNASVSPCVISMVVA